jgi:DNA-binding CsgD family transcriptional regulator
VELIEDPQQWLAAKVSYTQLAALVDHQRNNDLTGALDRIDRLIDQLPAGATRMRHELEVVRLGLQLRAGDADAVSWALATLADDQPKASKVFLVAPLVLILAQRGLVSVALSVAADFEDAMIETTELAPTSAIELDIAIYLALLWSGDIDLANGLSFTPEAVEQVGIVDPGLEQLGLGAVAMSAGVWSDAVQAFHASNTRYEMTDRGGFMAFALAGEALARAALGDRDEAMRQLARARIVPLRTCAVIEPALRLIWLEAGLWLGESDSDVQATALAKWAQERHLAWVELEAWHRWLFVDTRKGPGSADARQAALSRIEELAQTAEGSRVALLVDHARALAAGDHEMALSAERLLVSCGVWLPTVPLTRAVELTRREREVATMAARGMSSKVIAQRLVLSVRTVDSHLGRSFAKLGVSSREELARVLR